MSYEIPLYRLALVRETTIKTEDRPVIAKSIDVVRITRPFLHSADREVFAVLLLSAKHRVIALNVVSIGSLTAAITHPREVFKAAILANAAAIVLIHNHPSGDPEPSAEDNEITKRLGRAGELIGVRVLDHVVLGEESHFSYADAGRL